MADRMTAVGLRELSIQLEGETCYDSIPTIERIYEQNHRGSYICVFETNRPQGAPGCTVTCSTAERMWLHVHFSARHGFSFGKTLPDLLADRAEGAQPAGGAA